MIQKAAQIIPVVTLLLWHSCGYGYPVRSGEINARTKAARTVALASPAYESRTRARQQQYPQPVLRDAALYYTAAAMTSPAPLAALELPQAVRSPTQVEAGSGRSNTGPNINATLVAGLGIALISIFRRMAAGGRV